MKNREPWKILTVTEDDRELPPRLDSWLARKLPDVSRKRWQWLIKDGAVTVNGKGCAKGAPLKSGEEVQVWTDPGPEHWVALADGSIDLNVVHESPNFLVVEKPSGIPSVPLTRDEAGTLSGALGARFPECLPVGKSPGDSGMLQRLDGETSGLVLAARDQDTFDLLWNAQREGRIEKTYLALVRDNDSAIPETIDKPLGPAGPGSRMMGPSPDGRPASTAIKTIKRRGGWILVEATISRGARHQIRVHLASAGLPIAGDRLYGGPCPNDLERLFLHSAKLALPAFVKGENLGTKTFYADLPANLSRFFHV